MKHFRAIDPEVLVSYTSKIKQKLLVPVMHWTVWILTNEKSVLTTLSHTAPIHLHLVNTWEKEDLITMIVVVEAIETTDALVEVVLVLMTDVESIIVQEVVADLGLVKERSITKQIKLFLLSLFFVVSIKKSFKRLTFLFLFYWK